MNTEGSKAQMRAKGKASEPLVMIVEDEEAIALMLTYNLKAEGFRVVHASRGDEAELMLAEQVPDLLILDWMLPAVSGLEVCRRLRAREETSDLPVIMLTARGEENERVRGLFIGADDYVVKPFGLEELILRVRAIIRRSKKSVDVARTLKCGPITLDEELHKVTFGNDEINLSPTEFRLLQMLIEKKGRVLSKALLLDEVWGITFESESTVVDTYISYLRKKLHRDGYEGIKTIRGVGFQINEPKETV
jgi:phosphate regulon transcriptional regulator PhoB